MILGEKDGMIAKLEGSYLNVQYEPLGTVAEQNLQRTEAAEYLLENVQTLMFLAEITR